MCVCVCVCVCVQSLLGGEIQNYWIRKEEICVKQRIGIGVKISPFG